MKSERNSQACRSRLIEVAGEMFGERGYRDTTIREIAKRSGFGLGLVHYHFEDKDGLYRAVCAHAFEHSISDFRRELADVDDPEERLLRCVRIILRHAIADERPAWHGRVFVHGLTEPNGALADFVRTLIRPHHELLAEIVAELLGEQASADDVFEHTLVIVGQCTVHHHAREVVAALRGRRYDSRDIERLAQRVVAIALAGIQDERGRRARRASKRPLARRA